MIGWVPLRSFCGLARNQANYPTHGGLCIILDFTLKEIQDLDPGPWTLKIYRKNTEKATFLNTF
jgi:hypothetical protein